MKITHTLLAITTILSLAFTTSKATTRVLDIDGKSLRSGTKYHISPAATRGSGGGGGGLKLAAAGPRDKKCPLNVALVTSVGSPVTFSPANRTHKRVTLSADLNIKFSAAPTACVDQSTVWRLGEFDETVKQWFVTGGGVEGDPGPKTLSNWFKIERYSDNGSDYKVVFCPTVCNFCKVLCRDVGVFVKDGFRRLALTLTETNTPFVVVFKRA